MSTRLVQAGMFYSGAVTATTTSSRLWMPHCRRVRITIYVDITAGTSPSYTIVVRGYDAQGYTISLYAPAAFTADGNATAVIDTPTTSVDIQITVSGTAPSALISVSATYEMDEP